MVGRLKGNFFTVDLDTARTAFEQMPWVRHASVRRVWPNALAVTLEEFKPLGTWGSDQLVSVDGELFTANQGELDDDLPAFDGPDGTAKEVVARYRDFTKWFAPLDATPGRSDAVAAFRVDGEALERHADRTWARAQSGHFVRSQPPVRGGVVVGDGAVGE